MDSVFSIIILFVTALFLGSVPFGLIVVKFMNGKDLRQSGSANIGATNAARIAGLKAGILTLVLDMVKGSIPVLVAFLLFPQIWIASIAGIVAVTGHMFSIFLRFKGGKGVGTSLGVLFLLAPFASLSSLAVFIIFFVFSKKVSPCCDRSA